MADAGTNSSLDAVEQTLRMAAQVLAGQGDAVTRGFDKGEALFRTIANATQHAHKVAQVGLLPLCIALALVHEHYAGMAEGHGFRVGRTLFRIGAVVALLIAYGQVCGLITSVAGGHGGWLDSGDLLNQFTSSTEALSTAWNSLGGDLSDLPQLLALIAVWLIVLLAALFAYTAGLLLSLSQAASLTLLLALGKTCLVVSIVPGVRVGASWAWSLAQVAAWSTVAGVLSKLLTHRGQDVSALLAKGELMPLMKAAAEFVVLGISMLSVPKITSSLMSGVAPAASAAGQILGTLGGAGKRASAMIDRATGGGSSNNGGASGASSSRGAGSNSNGGGNHGQRLHKLTAQDEVAPERPKEDRNPSPAQQSGINPGEAPTAMTAASRPVAPGPARDATAAANAPKSVDAVSTRPVEEQKT